MDDKFRKQLVGILDEYFDKKFILMFNQGFEDIILPEIERLDKKMDRVEMRVTQIDNKLDLMSDKLLDHETRLKRVETKPAITHQIRK